MATRKDIRVAFYSELESSVNGLVDPKNVRQEQSELSEDYPAVVHSDNWRKFRINEGSNGPSRVSRDGNGDAEAEHYASLREAVFEILVVDDDEQRKEDVYEAVVRHFEKYEHPKWDASDIHEDVNWVRVFTSNSEDDVDHEPIVRGDRFQIRLVWTREYDAPGTAISQVDTEVDADNDGTSDVSFTFSG